MRKMFLSILLFIGLMNFCFGQINTNIQRISVKTYNETGLIKQFKIVGNAALEFDIPAFIKENENLERVVINGLIRSKYSTKTMSYDSSLEETKSADKICTDVQINQVPFLGVFGVGSSDGKGVTIRSIIPGTSAERAGMVGKEIIVAFGKTRIHNFPELQKAVSSSKIGDQVVIKFKHEDGEYSKSVVLGSRGLETVNYTLCEKEEEIVSTRSLEEVSFTSFPNPTSAKSTVDFKSTSLEDVEFKVTDISGRIIYTKVFINNDGDLRFEYNLENQNSGTYIFSMQQGKELYTRKVQLINQ